MMIMTDLSNRTILMVVAPLNFRDEELFVPKEFFEKNGAKVVIASEKRGTVNGMLGGTASADLSVSEVNSGDYDAVIFVGGSGVDSHRLYENSSYLKVAMDADSAGRIVGAICLGPMILAGAGLLSGRKASVFMSGAPYIEEKGATHTGASVTRDGRIITAAGTHSIDEFEEAIADALKRTIT